MADTPAKLLHNDVIFTLKKLTQGKNDSGKKCQKEMIEEMPSGNARRKNDSGKN